MIYYSLLYFGFLLTLHFCVLNAAEYSLSICAIFQNEAPYLKEWMDFHLKVGVEHFWLYNHLSTDNYKEVLRPYIEREIVELIEWKREYTIGAYWNAIQCAAYCDGISRSMFKTKWLAVIDTDEFLYPVEKDNLVDFLRDYDEYSAIAANWQMFGTSHVPSIAPDECMLKKLVWKADFANRYHKNIKCIVKPKHVLCYLSPHFPILKGGALQVNADKVYFEGPLSPYCSINKICINHYWSRDEYFLWHNKMPRRVHWGKAFLEDFLREAEEFNAVYDTTIHKFLD